MLSIATILDFVVSIAVYLAVVFCGLLLAHDSDRRNSFLPLALFTVGLIIMSSMRGRTVGVDTVSYYGFFLNGCDPYVEAGFSLLTDISRLYFNSQFYFGVIAALIYIPIFFRLWELRSRVNLTLTMAAFLTMFWFSTWNGARQWIAIALCFFAYRYIEKKRYITFIAIVLLATSMHKTSIICLALLAVIWLYRESLSRNGRTLLLLALLSLPLLVPVVVGLVQESSIYTQYIDTYSAKSHEFEFGLSNLIRYVLIICAIALLVAHRDAKTDRIFIGSIVFISVCAEMLVGLGYVNHALGRLGLYFQIYDILLFGWMWQASESSKTGVLVKIALIVYLSYSFISVLASNGQQVLPFYFV